MSKYLALLLAGLFLAACSSTPDPASVIEQLEQAEAARDVEALTNLFAPDAVIRLRNTEYRGSQEIEIFWNGSFPLPWQTEYNEMRVDGNVVTWNVRTWIGDRVEEFSVEATVEDGNIVLMVPTRCRCD